MNKMHLKKFIKRIVIIENYNDKTSRSPRDVLIFYLNDYFRYAYSILIFIISLILKNILSK